MSGWSIFGQPVRGRSCGSCTFCCTMVPVDLPLNKPAGVACQHLCSKGCKIYAARPDPCKYWNCTWLYQPETADMRRPDKAGYVIDPMFQEILIDHQPCNVLQVWVDPARPEAHRDPALRAYLALMADRHRMPAVVRWAHPGGQEGADAMVLVAPCLSGDGEWIERHSAMISEADIAEKLRAAKIVAQSENRLKSAGEP